MRLRIALWGLLALATFGVWALFRAFPPIDYGQCLKWQQTAHHEDARTSLDMVIEYNFFSGDFEPMLKNVDHPARDWVTTDCVHWEFPQGRMEKD